MSQDHVWEEILNHAGAAYMVPPDNFVLGLSDRACHIGQQILGLKYNDSTM